MLKKLSPPRKVSWLLALASLFTYAGSAQAKKTLVYCSEGSPEGLYPSGYSAGTTFDVTNQIYSRLFSVSENGDVLPFLADSYEVSADGLTYTLHLKKGVQWASSNKSYEPSREFTADDVVWTFKRMSDPDHPYHKVAPGNYKYYTSTALDSILVDVVKEDDHTVVFQLNSPYAPFISVISMDFLGIGSAEYADFLAEQGRKDLFERQPVGTGPFILVSYRPDAHVRFRSNKNYFEGAAEFDNLVFAITPDATLRSLKLKQGECHLYRYPIPQEVDELKKDSNLAFEEFPGYDLGYLSYNVQKEHLEDVRVRKALDLAINRDTLIEAVFDNKATAAGSFLPPLDWAYDERLVAPQQDLVKAQALIDEYKAEKGIEGTLSFEIWAMPVQRPYNPNARRMAELIQSEWKKIGVEVRIVSFEWGEYLARSARLEHDIAFFGWTADIADPDNFLGVLLSCDAMKDGNNRSGWCYEPFQNLIEEGRRISDQEARRDLYRQAQQIVADQVPVSVLNNSQVVLPYRKEISSPPYQMPNASIKFQQIKFQ